MIIILKEMAPWALWALSLRLRHQLLSSANLTFPAGISSPNLSQRNGRSWKGDFYIQNYRLQVTALAFSWFWNDLSKTHLLWIKLIFFFQSGSLVVLYPYLVIHMRSLGLSVEEGGDKVIKKYIFITWFYHCRWLSSMESSLLPIS